LLHVLPIIYFMPPIQTAGYMRQYFLYIKNIHLSINWGNCEAAPSPPPPPPSIEETLKKHCVMRKPVSWVRIRIHMNPHWFSSAGSGGGQKWPIKKKIKIFRFLSAGWGLKCLLLQIFHEGQGRNKLQLFLKGDFWFFMYVFQHCFICLLSDSTVSEELGIEPRTIATLALTARRSYHSARSHLHPARSHPPKLLTYLLHFFSFFGWYFLRVQGGVQ
jgi:hypothetical protein